MLVLSRKPGESIKVGAEIEVTVVRIGPNVVRIGITAPRSFHIARSEREEPGEELVVEITDQ